jgi:hypothetical protein
VSQFRHNATSLERLLALIRPVLDCTGARDASPRTASFRRRDRLCDARVDVRGAHVIFACARQAVKSSTVPNKPDLRAVVAVCWKCDSDLVGCEAERLVRLTNAGQPSSPPHFDLAPTRGHGKTPRVGAQSEPILSVCQLTLVPLATCM